MDSSGDQQDENESTEERSVSPENNVDQSHCPRDESTVSANPSQDAVGIGWLRHAQEQTRVADPGGHFSSTHTPNYHSPFEWDATHGGYVQNVGGWDGYPQYSIPAGLHLPPVVYYGNPSCYSYNFMPPYISEGQIYSPQQIPTYYPQPTCFVMSPAMYISPTESVTSNSNGDDLLSYPRSGDVVRLGSQGGVNFSGNQGTGYFQSTSIPGPSKKNRGQLPLHGYPASSSSGGYPQGEPRPSSFTGNEQNGSAASALSASLYNRPDFETDYTNAKFFIMKSLYEDKFLKSIKHNVWTSSPNANEKLNAAYQATKKIDADSPVFLFFSVTGSGHFCGVAEMVGPVNFEKHAECWHWKGQFPVKWHIIKNVPNDQFGHILLQGNKPVSTSENSLEVKQLEQGIEMLKIFKDYNSLTSLLDRIVHCHEREQEMVEKKQNEQVSSPMENASDDDSVNQISDRLSQTLTLKDENSSGLRRASNDESLGSSSSSIKSEERVLSAETADDDDKQS